MRVLALFTDLYGMNGGIAEYNRFFIQALSEIESVTKVVALARRSRSTNKTFDDNTHDGSKHNAMKIECLEPHASKWVYAGSAFLALLFKGPFDVVWCGHIYMAPLARVLAWLGKSSLWLQIHGIEAWQEPPRFIKRCVQKANRILAVSRYTRRKFLAWANVLPEKVKVLPNTFDAQRFYPGPKNTRLLKKWNTEGKKVLLTVGRLASGEMYKGHDAVICALPELLKRDPNWVYWIAGDGDDRSRLEKIAREAGVLDKVKFLGFVAHDDLPEVYRSADVFIMLSRGEGFGIVYLEARGCGMPVIASDQDAASDPLLDGRVGQLIKQGDSGRLAAAIEKATSFSRCDTPAEKVFSYSNFAAYQKRFFA